MPSRALRRALPMMIAAGVCIVAGGLLAAATAYVTTEKTAWATAYLVLVGGVAQAGIAAATGWLAPRATTRTAWVVFALWNLGNVAVLTGQLGGFTPATFLGGALLALALVIVVIETRGASGTRHPVLVWGFRVLAIVLAVTIPIGLVLAVLGR